MTHPNGYTKVDNRLLQLLYSGTLSGQELRAVLYVMRYTHGYHQALVQISLNAAGEDLHLHPTRVSQLLTGLVAKKLIVAEGEPGKPKRYGVSPTLYENLKGLSKVKPFKKS
jgi:phage replication O-like protein O